MLNVEQILNAKFTPVSKGAYSSEDVDAFLTTVAKSYQQSLDENEQLIKKISILADKIESYRNDEEAIKLALLDAHRMAETITKNANITAKDKLEDAETRSKIIIDGANRQSNQIIEDAKEKAKEIVDNARTAVSSLTARAQTETEQAIVAAQKKAAEIVKEAEAKGQAIIGNSKSTYEYYSVELDRVKNETKKFKEAVAALCNSELKLVDDFSEDLFNSVTASPFVAKEVAEEAPAVAEVVEEQEVPVIIENEEVAEVKVIPEVENAVEEEELPEVIELDFDDEEPAISDIPEVEEVPDALIIEEESEVEIIAEEILEVPESDVEPEAEEDLFSSIESIEAPDISSLDALIPSLLDDDEFEGFKVDLDSVASDSADEDDDITSLFDSLFDE